MEKNFINKQRLSGLSRRPTLNEQKLFGRDMIPFMEFLIAGRNGKEAMYSTPEGNFLSPKAVEKILKLQKKEIIKNINKENY